MRQLSCVCGRVENGDILPIVSTMPVNMAGGVCTVVILCSVDPWFDH